MGSFLGYLKNIFTSSSKIKPLEELSSLLKTEDVLAKLVTEKKVPGIAVTCVKEGQTIFQQGFGYANMGDNMLMDPKRSIVRIASISKCITGLALGKMVEEGIVGFDDSFYEHIPHYPKKKYNFTLRQLASHTAGIRSYRGKEFALNETYSIKESLQVFQKDPLVFEPGKGYLYNSFDFVLLSLAMQEASGVPFEEYVKQKVLTPLGMVNTFSPLSHAEPKRRVMDAEFYTNTTGGFKKAIDVNNFYKLAGGGYLSTSEDVALLGQELLNQKLLHPKTYQQLLTAQEVNGKSVYYGLGFQVSEDKYGRFFIGHVGSSVGAYSNLFVYPKEKIVLSILINCTDPKVQSILDAAIDSTFEHKI